MDALQVTHREVWCPLGVVYWCWARGSLAMTNMIVISMFLTSYFQLYNLPHLPRISPCVPHYYKNPRPPLEVIWFQNLKIYAGSIADTVAECLRFHASGRLFRVEVWISIEIFSVNFNADLNVGFSVDFCVDFISISAEIRQILQNFLFATSWSMSWSSSMGLSY